MSSRKLVTARTITILLFVVLPFVIGILLLIYQIISEMTKESSPISSPLLALIVGTFFVDWFWYIPYHTRDKPEKYFKKIGFEHAVSEYQFSKKLFYVVVAISILIIVYSIIFPFTIRDIPHLIVGSMALPIFVNLIVLTIRFGSQYARKDFDFYWTRAYFVVSSQKEYSLEKFKYLKMALDTYNRFLERNLKLKIKDIMRIYSMFMLASTEQKFKIRDSIGEALEKDELELARQLAELSSLQDKEQFLIREPKILNQGIKDILTILIPTIISIVGFVIGILKGFGILPP
jgi:hypothetical protein